MNGGGIGLINPPDQGSWWETLNKGHSKKISRLFR
jgi:hypothetical protein